MLDHDYIKDQLVNQSVEWKLNPFTYLEELGMDTGEAETSADLDEAANRVCSFAEQTTEMDVSWCSFESGWCCLASWGVYTKRNLAAGTSHTDFHRPRQHS